MPGATDLAELITAMRPELCAGTFVFATVPHDAPGPDRLTPLMTFHEREGRTLIVPEAEARAHGLGGTHPCRMITLQVHSALDAVGFLAAVTACLASAGISVNAVSAYHHDHVFVPAARAEEAMALLQAMSREAG